MPRLPKIIFQLALAAEPDSLWALRSLAMACAMAGDRKGALDALQVRRIESGRCSILDLAKNRELLRLCVPMQGSGRCSPG